ncbi:MAG: ligase-associated DNA damage response exonuclease [Desulfobacterales bacterium]|nr:MAG: ligase-associated DNA damage response exonuclease [Desulfobacterales bacterium]
MLEQTPAGLYCRAGNFHIDPWQPVENAVITHGHGDHARWGSKHYLAAESCAGILRARLGEDINLQTVKYGETISVNGLHVSLHPAGHILGSAQVRLERGGEVWVVSGDYKIEPDVTCASFEPLKCHTFVSESTFGLPVFKWRPQAEIFADINSWWRKNRDQGQTSILYAYSLGKAQRIIAGLDPSIGPIFTHGAVENMNRCYRAAGIALPPTRHTAEVSAKPEFAGAMVVAPPSADSPGWIKKFPQTAKAFASGWMQIRGNRRRRSIDRGFVLSDHSDWPGLITAIRQTGAETIWVSHGYTAEMVQWLRENGLNAMGVATRFSGEIDEENE